MTARSLCIGVIGSVFAAAISGCGSSAGTTSPPEEWTLVLEDNFDGEAGTPPDETIWQFDVGGDGWGNNQLEYNTPPENGNVVHDGEGHLQIIARREQFEDFDNEYTSGRINTAGLFEQKYGRFEARIQVPPGAGFWPAFWLLGADFAEVDWPRCGEIDVMEWVGRNPTVAFGSLHGPQYSGADSFSRETELPDGGSFADAFHVYRIDWDPGQIRFYVDDELYQTRSTAEILLEGPWVFDHEFFILLNLAVGGNLGGPVGSDTEFPATMLIDYVRVYERAK
jgi:beta-glucanase (GH16 family)